MSDWYSAAREADGRTDDEIEGELIYKRDASEDSLRTAVRHALFAGHTWKVETICDACADCRNLILPWLATEGLQDRLEFSSPTVVEALRRALDEHADEHDRDYDHYCNGYCAADIAARLAAPEGEPT